MAMVMQMPSAGASVPSPEDTPLPEEFCGNSFKMSAVVLDSLDDNGVSDELLAHWSMQEKQGLRPVADRDPEACSHEEGGLPAQARQAAMSFLVHLPQCVGLPATSWFEAATLLDMYYLKAMKPSVDAVDSLAATCVAIIAILKKDDCLSARVDSSIFVPRACMLAKHLEQLGYDVPTVTADLIDEQERHVLRLLEWRVHVPSSFSWISAFTVRFNVFTRSMFSSQLSWVWQQSVSGSRFFTMQQAASSDLPPATLAAGLFAIGLVTAGLIPLESLQPADMGDEEWLQLYKDVQANGQQPGPQCKLPEKHARCVLEILAMAVGVSVDEIRQCCSIAFNGMRTAVPRT